MSPALTCSLLSCGYPDKPVLRDVNLTVAAGSILTLLGPNGSGKSTLLRTITGEVDALSGSIKIGDDPADSLSARERARRLAFVPSEERTEFPFLVREIVAMGRIPHSEGLFETDEDNRIVREAMERSQCRHIADQPINKVSAGERQRALLGRALAQQAPILLLDEPTSHLDPGHQISFTLLIRQLAAQGLTVLVALHDLNLAAHLATHAALLLEGRCAVTGSIGEVLASPLLDQAYGARFDRHVGEDGVLRLYPDYRTVPSGSTMA